MPIQLESTPAFLAPGGAAPARAAGGPAGPGFGDALQQMLQGVETSSGDANKAVADMMSGTGDVHDAMIALQRAESTLELTIQVRNKLVQAYQDVMRMPV
jgi:flagellar hook-basal body complex protein FliE